MLTKLIFSSLVLRLLNVLFVAGSTFLLANILSVEQFGIYSLLLSYVALSTIPLQSSIPIVNIRTISRNAKNGIPSTLISFSFLVTIVYLAAVLMLDSLLAITIGSPISPFRIEFYLLTIVMLFLSYLVSYIQGMNKIITSQLIEQIARPFVFLLPILFVSFFNYEKMLFVTNHHVSFLLITSYLFSILIASLYLFRGRHFFSIITSELNSNNWFQVLLLLSSLSGLQVLLSQMDSIVLANVQGHESLAEYRIATQFSIALSMISTVVGGVIAPKINQLYNKDNKTLEGLVYKMNWISFFVGSGILLFYYFFSKWIILSLLGDKYVSVYVLLLILCLGQFISSLFGPVSTIVNMLSLEKRNLLAILIAVLFNLIALLILIPLYGGGVGAAISTSIAMVFWKLSLTFLVRNKINIVCHIRY